MNNQTLAARNLIIIVGVLAIFICFAIYKIRKAQTRSQLFRKKIKYLPKNKRNLGSLNSENDQFQKVER